MDAIKGAQHGAFAPIESYGNNWRAEAPYDQVLSLNCPTKQKRQLKQYLMLVIWWTRQGMDNETESED